MDHFFLCFMFVIMLSRLFIAALWSSLASLVCDVL